MSKNKIVILLIGCLLFPIILNFILGLPAGNRVISDENGWLGFWGNYSGSLITGIISFVVLYSTISANFKQQQSQINEERQKALSKAIAERLPHLNYSRLLLLKADLDGTIDVEYEKTRIDCMYSQVSDDFNSFSMLYAKKYPEFVDIYSSAVDEFQSRLRQINKELSEISRINISETHLINIEARNLKEIIDDSFDTKPTIDKLWIEGEKIVHQQY